MTVRAGVVSTIIPVYNRPHLLAEAVASVLAQTYRPIEIVIVDDGSTDTTGAVADAFAAEHPDVVRVVRLDRNGGFSRAVNTGLRLVTGEFVQCLDSDDVVMPEKFAVQVAGLRAHPECGISYCYAREYPLDGRWSGLPARRTGETFTQLFPAMVSGRLWPSPVPLSRRAVIEASGLYQELSIHPEWEYECRAAVRGVRLHHARAFLADVRGVHHLEGRQKGSVLPHTLPDYVQVLAGVLGHARQAAVPPAALDLLSRRIFSVARLCAAAGLESEARRALELGRQSGLAPRRWRMALYASASDRLGWPRAARWCVRAERSRLSRAMRAARRWPGASFARWQHRATTALDTISGRPVGEWPHLLAERWADRASRRVSS